MTGFAFAHSAVSRVGEARLRALAVEIAELPAGVRSWSVEVFDSATIGVEVRFGVSRRSLTSVSAASSAAVRRDQLADAGRDRDALAAALRRELAIVDFEKLDPLEQRAMDGDR